MALKWAITEKFSNYLKYGPEFTVYTDNNPLTYVLTSAKFNAVGLRWVAELADLNFTLKYRPRKINIDADYLSRRPIGEMKSKCVEECSPEILDSVISGLGVKWVAPINVCKLAVEEIFSR